jgi:6-phosphogluconolactonase
MPTYVYVSLQDDDKIMIYTMDADSGKLTPQGEEAVAGGPAAMCIDPAKNIIFVGRRGVLDIASFRVNQANGGLSPIGTASLQGEPVYLATDKTGKFLLSAYYHQKTTAVHRINADGVADLPPVEWLQTAMGAHSIQTDASNRFAFVPHIANRGPNAIYQFKFDQDTGHLTPNSPPMVEPSEYLGPRHFCFHPSQDFLFCTDEQGCSVTGYRFDKSSGTLEAFQTISTLPEGYTERNSCSQIQISPSGRFLYAPNRGHNSIASFAVDGSTGRLTAVGRVATEAVPRAFSLDPDGKFVFAAGLETGRLASFVVDQATGGLTPSDIYDVGNKPMWVLTVKLAE